MQRQSYRANRMHKNTHVNPHGIRNTVHVEKRLSGVHPAEEAVQDCLGADNVAILVRLNASEQQVLEVFLHQEEATAREGL